MKQTLLMVVLLCATLPAFGVTKNSPYQHGTVIRMRMGDCLASHRFVAALSGGGGAQQQSAESCPEYTLMTDKVVYVIVGKSSDQLIPLAETIDFRFQKNELAVRVDDANKESRFLIKEMALRTEWEQSRDRGQDEINTWVRHHAEQALAMKTNE
jgi:hypothetical protein